MKRALLVTAGTAVGLVSVLSYSGKAAPALAGAGGADGLAAPAPAGATAGATAAHTPKTTASGTPTGKPTTKAKPRTKPATPKPTSSRPTARSTSKPPSRKPTPPTPPTRPSPSGKPTPTPTPKPKPTPTKAAGPVDYLGPVAQSKYGPLQVSIRVVSGKLVDVWAGTYPTGSSQPYSEMAIPILKAQTLAARSADIAGATGASFTSAAWRTSLSGALAKAHL